MPVTDTFAVRGGLKVIESATVLCARYNPSVGRRTLAPADCGWQPGESTSFLRSLFLGQSEITVDAGWEVLLGQAEGVNWLRSTPTKLTTMRYAGEWKIAGGNVDEGETVYTAACRELSEEFLHPLGQPLPRRARIRPFICKQTRPIRSKSNLISNFVALEDENEWLRDFDVDAANRQLAERRSRHKRLLETGEFWKMDRAEKELVSPEVRELRWMSLHEALGHTMSSMAPSLVCVNKYQEELFARLGRKRRDPMFITGATMHELDALPGCGRVREWCASVDLASLAKQVQWLYEGMTDEEAREAMFNEHRKPSVNVIKSTLQRRASGRARM
eukprot:TRINITY_DN9842_c0_g1_i1.p1 TRINITY_DN9842_c0_g1~~TRINITY_DN9842_c0_g1_i1.p1  ORF type:complete len:351 (+),score=99.83 TRINITY_DN9842_c0_g1_i1:59-1054(+)